MLVAQSQGTTHRLRRYQHSASDHHSACIARAPDAAHIRGTQGVPFSFSGAVGVQASVLNGPYGAARYSSMPMRGSYGYAGQRADAMMGLPCPGRGQAITCPRARASLAITPT
jgi:hypothetical protein